MPVSAHHPHAEVLIPASQLHDRPRWLRARQSGVTATDARVLAGHGYAGESIYSHWQEKFSDTDAVEDVQPLRVRLGSDLEPVIAKHAGEQLGITTAKVGMLRSTRWPFVLASPDRVCSCSGLVELKTTDRYRLASYRGAGGDVNADGWALPPAWQVQGAHQILTSGRDHIHFAALIGRDELTTWTVEFSDEQLALVLARAELFWEQVKSGNPPPIDWSTVTVDEMRRRYPAAAQQARVLTPDELATVRALLLDRQGWKAALKAGNDELDAVENQLREIIGDAVELWADPADAKPLLRYPVTTRSTLKRELVVATYPDLDLTPCLATTQSRAFTAVQRIAN